MSKLRISAIVFSVGTSLATAGHATAQGEAQAHTPGAQDAATSGLEEVVVTARRREEQLQDVPVAITAFSAAQIREHHVQTGQDLNSLVAGLSVTTGVARDTNNYNIRGMGTTLAAGPGVVTYFDEVPLPRNTYFGGGGQQGGGPGLYFDLDNVQVLKGPQGTLFGRNTTGGAVLLQPKKPTNDFEGYVQAEFGNYGDEAIEAAVNIPVVPDKLLVRIAGSQAVRDGFTHDVTTGKDLDNRDYWAGRVSVTFRPTEDFENQLVYYGDYNHDNGSGVELFALNPTGLVAKLYGAQASQAFAQQQALGPRATTLGGDSLTKNNVWGLIDIARYDLQDNVTIRNIASVAVLKYLARPDLDGSALPILDYTTPGGWNTANTTYTEELQAQGSALSDHLTWVVGGYFELYHPAGTMFSSNVQLANSVAAGTFNNIYGESDRTHGFYTQETYDFGNLNSSLEGLKFTAGVRYTWDDKSDFNNAYSNSGKCTVLTGALPNCTVYAYPQSSAASWTFGLDYKLTPDTLIYVKGSRGYKPGGFNASAFDPTHLTFGPELVKDVEIGIKKDWDVSGVRFRTNLDAFHDDYSGIQKGISTIYNGKSSSETANAASATIEGVEFDGMIKPFTGLELSGNYTFLSAHYNSFEAAGPTGYEVPFEFAPKNKVSVTAKYYLPVPEELGDISVSSTLFHTSSIYAAPGDIEPYAYIPGYTMLNLRIDWNNIAGKPIDVAFFMNNATDELYRLENFSVYNSLGYTDTIWGEPRMFGFQIRYRWGPDTAGLF